MEGGEMWQRGMALVRRDVSWEQERNHGDANE